MTITNHDKLWRQMEQFWMEQMSQYWWVQYCFKIKGETLETVRNSFANKAVGVEFNTLGRYLRSIL